MLRHRHEHYAKLRTYGIGFGEDRHHLLRCGLGGDVIVLRLAAQQQIAHTSADQVGLKAVLAQSLNDHRGEILQHNFDQALR